MKRSHTTRVSIRPPVAGDWAAFIEAVRRSRALHRGWIKPKATTRKTFDDYLKRFAGGENHGLLVIHRESKDLVGMINLNNIVRGNFQCAALSYYAFEPHAGKGLMAEGLMLVLRHAFSKMKLHRLEANIQSANRASLALAKKFGFVKEGFSRRFVKVSGQWKDHERWALLAEDFPKRGSK